MPALPDAEGQSLVPLILDAGGLGSSPGELKGRALFAQLDRSWGGKNKNSDEVISIRREPYRFIYSENAPEASELFNHVSDPEEQENIRGKDPEMAAVFLQEAEDFLARPKQDWEIPEVELDEMMRAQLRALGYAITPRDGVEEARHRAEAERAKDGGKWKD
jgi:hypothetical protein